jgi:hypothetical protein
MYETLLLGLLPFLDEERKQMIDNVLNEVLRLRALLVHKAARLVIPLL